MRDKYRSLVKSILSSEAKLQESKELLHQAEDEVARAREFVEFNEAAIKRATDELDLIEREVFGG